MFAALFCGCKDASDIRIPELDSIAEVAASSDVWLVDIWGVMHNGVRPYASAVDACIEFRRRGGSVILVSNSPRPRDGVVRQLDDIGVSKDAYDGAVTSGDVTRRLIAAWRGRTIRHIGPERDALLFAGFDVTRGALETADVAVVTGLFDDERETPDDYSDELAALKARELTMICANPDIKVERGGRVIYCAGALAHAYEQIGGRVLTAGKPHAPIYDAAMALATDLRGVAPLRERVIAIGDGVKTDIAGAAGYGLRSIFVASAVDVKRGEPLTDAAARLFAGASGAPIGAMRALAW